LEAAKATLEGARKDLVVLEQTRDPAERRDAEAAQEARAAGKPEPKRSQVAAHDKKLDEARHWLKVETLSETQVFNSLQDALDEHADEWAESIERDVEALNEEWAVAINTLVEIHARRSRAIAIRAMVVGGDQRGVGALGFQSGQIRGIDFAQGAGAGYVPAGAEEVATVGISDGCLVCAEVAGGRDDHRQPEPSGSQWLDNVARSGTRAAGRTRQGYERREPAVNDKAVSRLAVCAFGHRAYGTHDLAG
jgi:hypothetical protein